MYQYVYCVWVLALCFSLSGCSKKTSPHTVVPPATHSLKQGESKAITVTVERNGFQEPVIVTLSGLPGDITIEPKDRLLSDTEVTAKFILTAKQTAKAKDHEITVTGRALNAMPISTQKLKLTVEEK